MTRSPQSRNHTNTQSNISVHLADELVDILLAVAEVTTFHVVLELARPPATSGVGQLERPKEVGGLIMLKVKVRD
jgi:hypothetical protein